MRTIVSAEARHLYQRFNRRHRYLTFGLIVVALWSVWARPDTQALNERQDATLASLIEDQELETWARRAEDERILDTLEMLAARVETLEAENRSLRSQAAVHYGMHRTIVRWVADLRQKQSQTNKALWGEVHANRNDIRDRPWATHPPFYGTSAYLPLPPFGTMVAGFYPRCH